MGPKIRTSTLGLNYADLGGRLTVARPYIATLILYVVDHVCSGDDPALVRRAIHPNKLADVLVLSAAAQMNCGDIDSCHSFSSIAPRRLAGSLEFEDSETQRRLR